jgi:hypothetical protein
MAVFNQRLMVTILRWTARIIGVALLGPIVLNAVWAMRHNGPKPFTASLQDNLLDMAMLMMTLGLLIGWKWEGIGGLLILGGVALLGLAYGTWSNVMTVAWLATGLLHLTCWWRTSRGSVGEASDRMELVAGTRIARRFWIPVVAVLAHATLVALTGTEIALSDNPEAGMVWRIFLDIDYPMSLCIELLPQIFRSNTLIVWTILVVGTIQWGLVGLVLQQAAKWIRQLVK